MTRKETVKVDGEDIEKDLVERFEDAIKNIEENDHRHIVPEFLKQGIDPVKEYKRFRKQCKAEVSLFGRRAKKKLKSTKA